MIDCGTELVWRLSRRGRELIAWDVDGLTEDATASIRLEDASTWWELDINEARDNMTVWVAGPDFTDPGDVLVVPTTSRAEIRIVAGAMTIFLDGGFIELVP